MSSDEQYSTDMPPEIRHATNLVSLNLIPEKSKIACEGILHLYNYTNYTRNLFAIFYVLAISREPFRHFFK